MQIPKPFEIEASSSPCLCWQSARLFDSFGLLNIPNVVALVRPSLDKSPWYEHACVYVWGVAYVCTPSDYCLFLSFIMQDPQVPGRLLSPNLLAEGRQKIRSCIWSIWSQSYAFFCRGLVVIDPYVQISYGIQLDLCILNVFLNAFAKPSICLPGWLHIFHLCVGRKCCTVPMYCSVK